MTPKPHSDLLAHVRASLDSEFEPDWEDAAEVYKAYASLVEQLEAAERKLAGVTSKTALAVSYAELANVVRDALELGTGPNADFPMGEYHDKAVAALDNLEEQLEASLTFADHFLQWCEGVAAEEDSPIHLLVSEARALNPAKRST